jgi:hypothetical protein
MLTMFVQLVGLPSVSCHGSALQVHACCTCNTATYAAIDLVLTLLTLLLCSKHRYTGARDADH